MAEAKSCWRSLAIGAAVAVALMGSMAPAAAFTEKQQREIFAALDPDGTGRVTRLQFETNKMNAFFYRRRPDKGVMEPLTFADSELNRQFFDHADADHDGRLDGVEINDAVQFDDIDTQHRGYFDFNDLVVFLRKIGR